MDNNSVMKAKELKALQNKIATINKEATRLEITRDNALAQLEEKLQKYMETYGINGTLSGLDAIKAFAQQEMDKVSKAQNEEVALRQKLINLYDARNIQGMRDLLGLGTDTVDIVVSNSDSVVSDDVRPKAKPQPKKTVKAPVVEEDFFFGDDEDNDFITPASKAQPATEPLDTDSVEADIEDFDFSLDMWD